MALTVLLSQRCSCCNKPLQLPAFSWGKGYRARTSYFSFLFITCSHHNFSNSTHSSTQSQDITLKDWLYHSWHSSFSTQSLLLQQELSHSFFILRQISDNTSGHFDSEHVTSPKGPIFSQVKIWQTPTFAISPVWHTIVLTHSPWYMNTELHARFSHSLWVSICISRRLCCCHLFYFWFKFSSLDFNSLKTYFYFFWEILNSLLFNTVKQSFSLVYYEFRYHHYLHF